MYAGAHWETLLYHSMYLGAHGEALLIAILYHEPHVKSIFATSYKRVAKFDKSNLTCQVDRSSPAQRLCFQYLL